MDDSFLIIHSWIGQGLLLGGLGCFLWGMVSVLFSPCHLASIPLMISYVAGQNTIVTGQKAASYAAVFTGGLFITIALVGLICVQLGRMMGDVGPYMGIAVGALLLWVSLSYLGVIQSTMTTGLMSKMQVTGLPGAFVLGLAYGILSGSCTFGFLAPILAIITIQSKIVTGISFIILFGIGHCIPIAVAGSFTTLVTRVLENHTWQRASEIFRKMAGLCIGLLGLYFLGQPLIG